MQKVKDPYKIDKEKLHDTTELFANAWGNSSYPLCSFLTFSNTCPLLSPCPSAVEKSLVFSPSSSSEARTKTKSQLRLDGPNVARPTHLPQLLAAGSGCALLARSNGQRLAARCQRLDEFRHALRR